MKRATALLVLWLIAPVTLLGCTPASRERTLVESKKSLTIFADVAARAADHIGKWASAREVEIARTAPSRDVGELQLAKFEAQMSRVDRAVALCQLAIGAAAASLAALEAGDGDLLVLIVRVKDAYDAVRALQEAIAAVRS